MLAAGSLSSCHLSDPEGLDDPEAATSMRLTSISSYMMTLISYEYDAQGRLLQINDNTSEMRFQLQYSGSAKTPSQITITDFSNWQEERSEWTNLHFNSDGYLSSWTASDFIFDNNLGQWIPDEAPYSNTCTYDSEGHLTATDDLILSWDNGDLRRIHGGESGSTDITVLYTELDNRHGCWSPYWMPLGVFYTLGIFGKAPAHMPARFSGSDEGEATDAQLAYQLNNLGMIAIEKIAVSEDGDSFTQTLEYNYAK